MSQPESGDDARLRVMQVIAAAIISGAGLFLLIAIFLRGDDAFAAPAPSPIITYVLLGVATFAVLAAQVVPGLVTSAGRQKIVEGSTGTGDGPLLALYQTQMIIGLALAEGAAFAVILAYMIEGQTVSLIAAVLFVGVLASFFPTRRGLDVWLAEQSDWLQRGG